MLILIRLLVALLVGAGTPAHHAHPASARPVAAASAPAPAEATENESLTVTPANPFPFIGECSEDHALPCP